MPLLKKLIKTGHSRAIVIPKEWLKYYEDKADRKLEVLLMEISESKITLYAEVEKNDPDR